MHEIITLQFGQQANYVGTHYWNTQESYFTYTGEDDSPVDHDVSFRPGVGADGSDTYAPRALIYDLKGSFGTLRRENALYELQHPHDPAQLGLWSGNTVPLQLPPIAPSPYQLALDEGVEPPPPTPETVRYWSDYSRVFYHPRSIVQLNEYELNSSLMPFEQWQKGDELFTNLDKEHDLLDRDLRPFLEECDQLQGIQVLSGVDSAWGGFASKYLERISDELGKGCCWVFGLHNSRTGPRERQSLQWANVAQSLYAIGNHARMHIPLSDASASLPSYLSLSDNIRWHTSALQSTAIESATLPTRLRSTDNARSTFDALEATLDGNGKRRVAACALSVDDPNNVMGTNPGVGGCDARMTNGLSHDSEEDDPGRAEAVLDISLFPPLPRTQARGSRREHVLSSIEVLRGAWNTDPDMPNNSTRGQGRSSNRPRESRYQSDLLYPLLSSYPKIFNFAARPQKLAVDARLTTTNGIAHYIRSVEGLARRLVDIDEREALCDGLAAMADEYEEDWRSDSESDDD